MSRNRASRTFSLMVFGVVLALAAPALAAPKYKTVIFHGSWDDSGGLEVTAGDDTYTVNFSGGTAAQCAQALVDGTTAPFTATRTGTEVRICHPDTTPKYRKVNISNTRVNSASYFGSVGATFGSTNLIETEGVAKGGNVGLIIEDLTVVVPTFPGEHAEQVVDRLMQQLDNLVPDGDITYSFGTEFTAAGFGGPPLKSVDIGIWQLGPRNLMNTQFFSNDPGLTMTQEPLGSIPTLPEWGLIGLGALVAVGGAGVLARRGVGISPV